LKGHPRSLETLPFDRAYMTSYLTLIETMRLSCTVFELVHFSSKVANFNPHHLHLSFEFRRELWCQKTRVQALSCGIICVILSLAVLIQYRSVTDTQTDTRRRHILRSARRRAVKRFMTCKHKQTGLPVHRTVVVACRPASRSATRDNAQFSKPCSCWPAAAGVGSPCQESLARSSTVPWHRQHARHRPLLGSRSHSAANGNLKVGLNRLASR